MTQAVARSGIGREAGRLWWLFLVTGSAWLLLSVIIFRFDWSSVTSISILFGLAMLGAAATEILALIAAGGWWRLVHGLLAAAFGVIGIIAFVHPGDTFKALAAVMSFYFILKGGFDVVLAFARHGEDDHWWVLLVLGIVELLLGFWAAGYFGRKAILLVVWVGAIALSRAIGDFVLAFALRKAARGA